ncbi:MAG: hypothetical protein ACKOXO_06910 [Cyanobium sp.]
MKLHPRLPRITLSIEERDHLALKLLSINQKKKMAAVIQEAISSYLDHSGAYKLSIHSEGPNSDS